MRKPGLRPRPVKLAHALIDRMPGGFVTRAELDGDQSGNKRLDGGRAQWRAVAQINGNQLLAVFAQALDQACPVLDRRRSAGAAAGAATRWSARRK